VVKVRPLTPVLAVVKVRPLVPELVPVALTDWPLVAAAPVESDE